jgi:hypothetical protein
VFAVAANAITGHTNFQSNNVVKKTSPKAGAPHFILFSTAIRTIYIGELSIVP